MCSRTLASSEINRIVGRLHRCDLGPLPKISSLGFHLDRNNRPTDQPRKMKELLDEYKSFEKILPLCEADHKTAHLAVFNGNKDKPIHRWFPFKEGFSAELFEWAMTTLGLNLSACQQIVDPFCGIGTSLLAAQFALSVESGVRLLGVEQNPFIRFVAQTKLNWFLYDVERIKSFLPILTSSLKEGEIRKFEVPSLSTIRNPSVFSPSTLQQLLAYRERIEHRCTGIPERDFFMLGWSAIIEKVSGIRRDGRALRFVAKNHVLTVQESLNEQLQLMLEDLKAVRAKFSNKILINATVIEGDGRKLDILGLEESAVDLIIYSPPYLNNIDYSEVYKLELWLQGFVASRESFRELRLKTFRSHPSVRFPETSVLDSYPADLRAYRLRDALISALPNDENRAWRERLFKAYIDDLLASLLRQFKVSKSGAFVICVVGNSMHGRKLNPIIIATDLFVASLAELAGFQVVKLQVTRQLRRRDHENRLLRETIVVLRKP